LDAPRIEPIDKVTKGKDEEMIEMAEQLARMEGLPVGISFGAGTFTTLKVMNRMRRRSKVLVTVLPDTGGRVQAQHSLVPSRIGVNNDGK
jgi:cysteine synthase A